MFRIAVILAATALCSASAYAGDSTTKNEPSVHDRFGNPVHSRVGEPVHHRFGDRTIAQDSRRSD